MDRKERAALVKYLIAYAIVGLFIFLVGCKDSVTNPVTDNTTLKTADKQAIQQIAEQDSAVASFDANFDEDQSMSFLSKEATAIYPVFVWHHVILVNKSWSYNIVGDTAYVTLTKSFEGVLNIAASTTGSGPRTKPDTIITKAFATTITRKLIFAHRDSTSNPLLNWKLVAISLPQGGTNTNNIVINKLTLTFSSGKQIVITSPNDYFFSRGPKAWGHFPELKRNDSLTVNVEIYSAYADTDFVTVTYGADKFGHHRENRKLKLISSTPSGSGFVKVFEQTYRSRQYPGFFHAVINAFTKQTIYDDQAPVEAKFWGIPYLVR